ncbi:hypothetical protein [Halomarina oriensis]|uniref:Uncharacterized protein n=1 Tax=Halomarina oriensis TaxID=671145 RepID=A0A6B0GI47_9EURY|nr:hypothetical protein [Halomarina oriensis]MWG33109.1 hypothetical protein [Halomarina oriensis]
MSHQTQSSRSPSGATPYESIDENPVGRGTAKKEGGSLRMTIDVEACRDVGIEPSEMEHGDEEVFFISTSDEFPGRIILDRMG